MHKTESMGSDCGTKKVTTSIVDNNHIGGEVSVVNASGDSGVLSASSSPGLFTNGHHDDSKTAIAATASVKDSASSSSNMNSDDEENNAKNEQRQEVDKNGSSDDTLRNLTLSDELILIQDTSFNIKVVAPGCESVDLQVSSMELVQEIHQILMDREEHCHRTCFSLQLDGQALDHFTELKNVENLREGSVLKIVEDPYTIREARIHLRHVRDLIKSVDSDDMYNAVDCSSVSFLNTITNCVTDRKKLTKTDLGLTSSNGLSSDCMPPDYVLPQTTTTPLTPLLPPKETLAAATSSSSDNQQTSKTSTFCSCLKILSPSGWNPPPGNRKLHGDLLYLYVLTAEDKRYHITCCTRGFYVNGSTEEEFNPKPANPKFVYHSLVDLLCHLSPIFKRNFSQIQKKRCSKHPFERVQTPYQVFSWTAPNLPHSSDFIRAEDAFAFKLGYEEHIPNQTREWNEELQTTRELPRKMLPERLLRERAVFKVHSDFVTAATRGAMAVVDGHVMAINPGDDPKIQMYIWNNIFFSLGYDVKEHYKDFGGDAAAFVGPNHDLQGVKSYFNLDPENLYVLGTVVVDYRGFRITAQSIIPGILERDQEQSVVYGSIDFGKNVVATEKYQELLKSPAQQLKLLPHKVKNANNDTIVTLYSSVESKGIIGNDGRHYILDLLRTFPPDVHYLADGEVNEISKQNGFPRLHPHKFCCLRQELLEAFVESRYITFIKIAAFNLQQSRGKNLEMAHSKKESKNEEQEEIARKIKNRLSAAAGDRQDDAQVDDETKKMVENLKSSESKAESEESTKEIIKAAALAVGSLSDTEFDVRFNPDCYSPFVNMAEEEKDLEKQKRLIRDAAEFLLITQIPNFIRDCLDHTFLPLDGCSLIEALHNRGINIRYLGKLTQLIDNLPSLQYLKTICSLELLCRSAKRLFRPYLTRLGKNSRRFSWAVAHFLNCFLGANGAPSPFGAGGAAAQDDDLNQRGPSVQKTNKKRGGGDKKKTSVAAAPTTANGGVAAGLSNNVNGANILEDCQDWTKMTPKSLWSQLKQEMDSYYGYPVESETIDNYLETNQIQKIPVLRRFCLLTGVQILSREYQVDNRQKTAFSEEDILSLFPVVKHINPRASDAFNFYTSGQAKIQQGQLRAGYDLVLEALNSLNNVYGALHPEIAQCLRLLARLAYILGDHQEAMSQQHKAVLMSERCNGVDHPQTIQEYTHLALYCFANWQVSTALKLLYRARYLLLLSNGENHPHMALLDCNIGLILHAVNEYDLSLKFLDNALKLHVQYFGRQSLKTALTYHLLARTQSCRGDFRSALQYEKETFTIYKNTFGDDHEKTRESGECLRHLTQQAVTFQKRMNEITTRKQQQYSSVSQLLPLQIQQPSLNSVLEMLNIVNGIVFIQISQKEVEALKAEIEEENKQQQQDAIPLD